MRLLLSLLVLVTLGVALAGVPLAAQGTITAQIHEQAWLVDNGQAIDVTVTVECSALGYDVLEAFLYVVQDGKESAWGGIPVVCDGGARTSAVRVSTFEPFHAGAATVSGYILLCEPIACSDSLSANIGAAIQIHCSPYTPVTQCQSREEATHVSSFKARPDAGAVFLEWETSSEGDLAGFHLYRARGSDAFTRLTATPIPAQGNAEAGAGYQYVDPVGRGHFVYQLVGVETDGTETLHARVESEVDERRLFMPMLQQ